MHIVNARLPFGGVGNSGMGHYHEKESFLAFSHQRSVLQSSNRIDIAAKYPPYEKIEMFKKII